jgi:NADH-quinone oxidoreductase subunit L
MLDVIYRYISLQTLIWLIAVIPLAGALLCGLISSIYAAGKGSGPRSLISFIGCIASLLSLAAASALFFTLIGFEVGAPSAITGGLFEWTALQNITINVGFKVDQLSMIFSLIIAGLGFLVHIYSMGFMSRVAGYARYVALINLFLFFMQIIVLSDNLILMFVGWEGVGICAYFLIGFWFDDKHRVASAMKFFIMDRVGDVMLLAAIFLIFGAMSAAGVSGDVFGFDLMSRYGAYFLPVSTWLSLLLFMGAISKSVQVPLHTWLLGSMSAPLPATALLFTATMVMAGVYMIVRLNFIFALSSTALQTVAIVGAITALVAATMGLVENNIKRILACATMSQLGYIFMAIGVGAFSVAILHVVMSAFFLPLIFLAAGNVIHALDGETDIRRMGGLKYRMPITAWCFIIGAIALAGIIPASGFFSRDAILWQAFERGHFWLWLPGFICAGLTSFYIFRAAGSIFSGDTSIPSEKFKKVVDAPVSMLMPVMLLTTLAALGGILGVPEALGGSDRLISWLGEIMPYELSRAPGEESKAAEIVLGVITVLWSIHFSVLGWIIYAQKRDLPDRVAEKLAPLYKVVLNGYYFDWFYRNIIAAPIVWFSKNILERVIFDALVDGLIIGGSVRLTEFLSRAASASQNGVLRQYLLYFLIGAVVIVAYMAL